MAAMTSIFANRIKPARLNPNPTIHLPITHIIQCAHVDNAILYHDRLLANLYTLEKRYQATAARIFDHIQSDIQPWMRKMVVSWLLEVCEEIQMEQEVYYTAVNITDRILSELYFKRDHFQLVGTAALMIASKLKETLPITPDKMVLYTDNSVSYDDLIQMEQIILSQLVWDVSCPTVVDFVDIFCQRSAKTFGNDKRMIARIKQLAQHISQKAVIEQQFIAHAPSTIAAACVCVAATELLPPIPIHATSLQIPVKKLSPGASTTGSPDKPASSGYATSCDNSSSTDVSPANIQIAQRLGCGQAQQRHPYAYPQQPIASSYPRCSGNVVTNPMTMNHAHSVSAFPSSRSNSDSSLASGEGENIIYNAVSKQLWENGTSLSDGHYRTASCSSAASSSSGGSAGTSLKLRVQYRRRTLSCSIIDMRKAAGNELRNLVAAIQLIGELGVWKIPSEDISYLSDIIPAPTLTIPPPPAKRQSLALPDLPEPYLIHPPAHHQPHNPPPLTEYNGNARTSLPVPPNCQPSKSNNNFSGAQVGETVPLLAQPEATRQPVAHREIYEKRSQPYTPASSAGDGSADSSSHSSFGRLAVVAAPIQGMGVDGVDFGGHLGAHSILPGDDLENIESILSSLFPDEASRQDMLI